MNNTPKISVLVPIYNVEKYLRQCIDSIVSQTLQDIEIILLDDGSTDSCPQICDEYAAKDKRIKVIHKPNSGYGATMNIGLEKATGEYIGIVESDDWIDADMYEKMYAIAHKNQVDVIKGNYYKYTTLKGDKKTKLLPLNDLNKVISPKTHSDIFYCPPSIWAALYKNEFLKKFQINFLESSGASYQDVGFNFKVWAMADKAWLTDDAFLHYRCDNENQSVKSKAKIFCVADEWANIEKFMNNYPEAKKTSYRLRNHIKLIGYLWNLDRLENESREEFRKFFAQEYIEILNNNGLKKSCYTAQKWCSLMQEIFPNSLKWKLLYHLQMFTQIFIKTKIKNNKKQWRILFGLIKVYERSAYLPSFSEKNPIGQ